MSPNFSSPLHSQGRTTRVVTALVLVTASLTCLAVGVLSGIRSGPGRLDGMSFAVVDSSNVSVTVNGDTFRGLPDANDFSKHKDFYAFYLWSYCSGTIRDGDFWVDFCSKEKQSLFDLFSYWSVWGANVHKEGTRFYWLQHGPKMLYISYFIAASLTVLELIVSIPLLFRTTTSRVIVVLSVIASISVLATSIAAQVTYGLLISRAEDDDLPITARRVGYAVYVSNWVATVLSFLAAALWYRIVFRNTVKRVTTMGQASYPATRASGRADPDEGYSFIAPLRKRTTFIRPS